MKNPNQPIYPGFNSNSLENLPGLSKREYFAVLAMQGILSSRDFSYNRIDMHSDSYCELAIKIADKLLHKLEENK